MKPALLLLAAASVFAADPQFVPLFDGKTLDGWEVCNGFATYRVEDGAIVGRTAEGSPNSFLCSKKEYGDFVLEFEVKTDPALNSGVQIRSHRYAQDTPVRIFDGKEYRESTQKAGRFYGYQVEIATAASGASGGIYDEARRGWVANISSDPLASKAFKDNEWNSYRIEARGDRIRTWVNGVYCADLVDSMDLSGQIGLQVHQYKGEKPVEVRWRNIRIRDLGRHVWKRIFDGKTMAGWKHIGGGSFTVEDGAFHCKSVDGDTRVGYVITDESWSNVTARMQFKIAAGNSGFFLRTDPETMAAYEVELDFEKRTGGFWDVRGRNWVTGPEDNAVVRKGEWNEMTASLHGHRIVFHVNGVRTIDLANDSQGWLEGCIALQAHGRMPTEVWFKDVEILVPEKK